MLVGVGEAHCESFSNKKNRGVKWPHPKVIQELLGHSNVSITLGIYGHLFPSMQQDVVEKWQDVFGEKDEDGEEDGGAVLG